jgi:polyisoprenyl-phosphate glycosyltransferase
VTVDYSFVIPILNERETIGELYSRLKPIMDALDGPSEVVLVDDGSTDGSYQLMAKLHERDPRIKALRLSRTFGPSDRFERRSRPCRGPGRHHHGR